MIQFFASGEISTLIRPDLTFRNDLLGKGEVVFKNIAIQIFMINDARRILYKFLSLTSALVLKNVRVRAFILAAFLSNQ